MTRNIILLTVDALRADHVSWHGYERNTTPLLEEFSKRCTVFESAYAASSHTRESVPSLLTGRHPTDAVGDGFTRGAETLPMLLPDEYATAAFHSNPYVSRAYSYDEGFDTFYDNLRIGQNKILALVQRALDKFVLSRGQYHARAEEINSRALSWLSSLSEIQPFFLWNHYMDVHGPYNPPEGFTKWSDTVSNTEAQRLYDTLSGDESPTEEEIELSKNLYDGEIRYVDAQIGQFINAIKTRGLLEESLVIITSDHGDLFGEYGRYAHPRYVYPELTKVPLIISGPDIASAAVSVPASTYDIGPTVLDAASRQNVCLPGQTLASPEQINEYRPVFSSATGEGTDDCVRRFAVQTTKRGVRFTRNQTTGDITEEGCYLLPSGEVVDSSTNSEFESLRTALIKHSDMSLNKISTANGDAAVPSNADIKERLEALGYK